MKIKKITEYKPWMIDALKNHVKAGWSVSSFSGYYKINTVEFGKWLKEVPELKEINDNYKETVINKKRSFI